MSLFISGMNLSVILFPPANLCPSSLRAHLSSLDRTQWRELLPKSFQHQLLRLLQGEEVTPGSSSVASRAQGSLWDQQTLTRAAGVIPSGSGVQQWHCEEKGILQGALNTQPQIQPRHGVGRGVWWNSQDTQIPRGIPYCVAIPQGAATMLEATLMPQTPEIWGWFSNSRIHLLVSAL